MTKSKVALALLAGVAIGAGIIALRSSKKKSAGDKLKRSFDDAKDNFSGKYESLKKKAKANAESAYADIMSDMNHKSEDVISFLEHKLEALKKEVAKY